MPTTPRHNGGRPFVRMDYSNFGVGYVSVETVMQPNNLYRGRCNNCDLDFYLPYADAQEWADYHERIGNRTGVCSTERPPMYSPPLPPSEDETTATMPPV